MNKNHNTVSRNLLESLAEFDGALLANTLDFIDSTPAHEFYMGGDIHSVTPALGPTVGVAFTCKMDTSTPGGAADTDLHWQQIEEITAFDLPAVWVVEACGSRPDHECIMGDGVAKTLSGAGCVGAVTNGRVRDVEGLLTVPFPVYCRGTAIHHCAVRVTEINVAVSVGGISVQPGDIIHAGAEGVIKLPAQSLDQLLEAAPRHRAVEHEVHAQLRRLDLSPAQKRKRIGDIYRQNGFVH